MRKLSIMLSKSLMQFILEITSLAKRLSSMRIVKSKCASLIGDLKDCR
jgi:hypothetical protein